MPGWERSEEGLVIAGSLNGFLELGGFLQDPSLKGFATRNFWLHQLLGAYLPFEFSDLFDCWWETRF